MARPQSTFIFLETDTFAAKSAEKKEQMRVDAEKGINSPETVRRPYRGIQIKDDVYATLSVRRADGTPIHLTSSSAKVEKAGESMTGAVAEYSDFILQRIDDQRVEKQQIIETFGEPFVYFFGERPRMVSFSGLLMNTEDFNWRAQFWDNYEKHLRGTKLVEVNARCYLVYDTILIEGYPLTATASDMAELPHQIPFQMQMFVTAYYDFSNIGSTKVPDQTFSLDATNALLDEQRGKPYVSTTMAVRKANLESRGAGGVLAELRSAIKKTNNMVGIARNYMQKAQQYLGGRIIRVPIGIAGALANAGTPEFATGSAPTVGSEPGTTAGWDARTGTFKTVVGSVKVRAPRPTTFAPGWTSPITGSGRGHYWENYDEYPIARKVNSNESNFERAASAALNAGGERLAAMEAYQNGLLKFTLTDFSNEWGQGTMEPSRIDNVMEAVTFVKSNFGMIMNAKTFVTEPGGPDAVARQILGLPSTRHPTVDMSRRGIKVGPDGINLSPLADQYIGADAALTFQGTANAIASGAEPPGSLGDTFTQGRYKSADLVNQDKKYESAYGTEDYTALVASNPEAEANLTESFGDSDAAPDGSEIDPKPGTFESVYGAGVSTTIKPGSTEQALLLQQSQRGSVAQRDEDTTGIVSVGDVTATIESVI